MSGRTANTVLLVWLALVCAAGAAGCRKKVTSIGQLPDSPAKLCDLLAVRDSSMRYAAAKKLAQLDERSAEARDCLLAALQSEQTGDVRAQLVLALSFVARDDARVANRLLAVLGDVREQDSVRGGAAQALRRFPSRAEAIAVALLKELGRPQESLEVQLPAVKTLQQLATRSGAPPALRARVAEGLTRALAENRARINPTARDLAEALVRRLKTAGGGHAEPPAAAP